MVLNHLVVEGYPRAPEAVGQRFAAARNAGKSEYARVEG